jgi:hypothetical protein
MGPVSSNVTAEKQDFWALDVELQSHAAASLRWDLQLRT